MSNLDIYWKCSRCRHKRHAVARENYASLFLCSGCGTPTLLRDATICCICGCAFCDTCRQKHDSRPAEDPEIPLIVEPP